MLGLPLIAEAIPGVNASPYEPTNRSRNRNRFINIRCEYTLPSTASFSPGHPCSQHSCLQCCSRTGFRGAPPPPRLKVFSISCIFFCKSWQTRMLATPPPRVDAPSYGQSWIRLCAIYSILNTNIFVIFFITKNGCWVGVGPNTVYTGRARLIRTRLIRSST